VSFGARILLAMVVILTVTVTGTMLLADRWLRGSLERSLTAEIEREARLAAAALPRDPAQVPEAARRLGLQATRRLTVIDSTGKVIGDSDFDDASLPLLENHLSRPEVQDALGTGLGISKRYSASTRHVELKVAIRAWPGVVRVSAVMEQVDAVVVDAQRVVIVAALAALLVGVVLAGFGGREVSRPLTQLAGTARSVTRGETPVYPTARAAEVRQLVHAFRTMQEELSARVAALTRGREETSAIIESMVESVAAVDAQGEVKFCNAALRRLLRYGADVPLPNLREIFRSAEAREVLDQALDGRVVLGREVTLDDRTVLATARPLPTGGAVICLHDVTDLRRLETVRRDFVANVTHELKTPLTSIAGYADTLLADHPDHETTARFLQVISANANRMHHLVDDLLDLARLESGTWQPRPAELDPRTAADAAWSEFADRAAAKGVDFTVSVPAGHGLWADAEALHQILSNLFDNALRHTPAGGRIEVEASSVDQGTQVVVRDTGSGIPAEHVPRVFERFYRVDPARSRDHGGTGLGLAIVKHLVEAHGGRVDLSSALGRGTTVRLTFPSHPATA
jgi:two-component system, OmpR family, phosphate regulon sensor histidine kinase PhoR